MPLLQIAKRNYLNSLVLKMWEVDHHPPAHLDKMTCSLAYLFSCYGCVCVGGGAMGVLVPVMYSLHCLCSRTIV